MARVFCWILTATLFPALSAAGADRALVVGIERYASTAVPPTAGSERDARELSRFLTARMGFPPGSVRILLNEEATASRIEKEFQSWLIAGSGPGDRVFFSYSGHGSRVPRTDGAGDFHNTLAPYDVDPESGAHQVLDTTIRRLVNQLAGRRAVLLFDSCHSGSIARSLSSAQAGKPAFSGRYLPTPAEISSFRGSDSGSLGRESFVVTATGSSRSVPAKSADRGMFLTTTMEGAGSGVISIAAAADHQVAFPFQAPDGKVMGALTWAFLESVGGGASPFGKVRTEIPAAIARLQAAGLLQGEQVPQFDVRTTDTLSLESQPLFGTWQTAAATAMQNPACPGRLSLRMAPKRPGEPYREGETFAFDVESSMQGYLYLLVFSEGRKASCLIPNVLDRDPRISAGKSRFPRKGEEFVVTCHPAPCGTDVAVAIVSEQPLGLGEKENYAWDEIFGRLRLKELEAYLGAPAAAGAPTTAGAPARRKATAGPTAPAGTWQAATAIFESRKR
ncbi:MAG: caspase family protein [Thermoanaerobaculia bacterium]|nr:caspase family protein [Thermoanaerobaculia bacterium]